jgi:hypothetical protein
MDLNKFKLGVGPMSPNVVDLCIEYSKIYNFPIMIIASRNQADATSGYAFSTRELASFVKTHRSYDPSRVLLCRDHCGPYFSDLDKGLTLNQAVARCFETIRADVDAGFDLIHIDVSKVPFDKQEHIATQLFDYALSLNPNLMFEFGSEDNTGENLQDSLNRLDDQLKFVSKYSNNVKYFVSQTGSLTKHTQVGSFSTIDNQQIADKIHSYGFLFKEHNADYLTRDDVYLRRSVNVDAINIAPQLGSTESKVIQLFADELGSTYTQFVEFTLQQDYWKKWVTADIVDDATKFIASGHYCFNSNTGQQVYTKMILQGLPFFDVLKTKLFADLDEYRIGYNL